MNGGLKVEGVKELQDTLNRFASDSDMAAALRPAMNKAGTRILQRSIALTPRDRGQLVNSAGLRIEGGARNMTVTIGYGTPYARRVHENPRAGRTGGVSPSGQRYRHWAATGQSKFLETAINEARGTVWTDVGREVEGWLRQQAR